MEERGFALGTERSGAKGAGDFVADSGAKLAGKLAGKLMDALAGRTSTLRVAEAGTNKPVCLEA